MLHDRQHLVQAPLQVYDSSSDYPACQCFLLNASSENRAVATQRSWNTPASPSHGRSGNLLQPTFPTSCCLNAEMLVIILPIISSLTPDDLHSKQTLQEENSPFPLPPSPPFAAPAAPPKENLCLCLLRSGSSSTKLVVHSNAKSC